MVALGLQFEASNRYVAIDHCEDICLYQTIAGNWQRQVPSLVHAAESNNVRLINSAVCLADAVITQGPGGWNAGSRSTDRSFARQTVWFAGDSLKTLDKFRENLTKDLTPARADAMFGKLSIGASNAATHRRFKTSQGMGE